MDLGQADRHQEDKELLLELNKREMHLVSSLFCRDPILHLNIILCTGCSTDACVCFVPSA